MTLERPSVATPDRPNAFGAGPDSETRSGSARPAVTPGRSSAARKAGAPHEETLTADLLAVASAADRAAFGRLFEHYAPRLKRYMLKLGAEASLAEELAQEAMVAVWRKARLFDPAKAAASTWVFTIARNLRIDAARRNRKPELDANEPMLVPEPPMAGDRLVEQSEQASIVQAALKTLPAEQAAVINLSFYEDLTHSEIAAKLEIPLGTVKSRMRLAFRRIQSAVGEAL